MKPKFKAGQVWINPDYDKQMIILQIIGGTISYKWSDNDKEWRSWDISMDSYLSRKGWSVFVDSNKIWKDLNS